MHFSYRAFCFAYLSMKGESLPCTANFWGKYGKQILSLAATTVAGFLFLFADLLVPENDSKEERPIFTNPRYITKGIETSLEPALQNILWYLIENMNVEPKDYLQVFRLSIEDNTLILKHSQETPPYHKVEKLTGFKPITARIFVIDDGTHSIMMLAEEY